MAAPLRCLLRWESGFRYSCFILPTYTVSSMAPHRTPGPTTSLFKLSSSVASAGAPSESGHLVGWGPGAMGTLTPRQAGPVPAPAPASSRVAGGTGDSPHPGHQAPPWGWGQAKAGRPLASQVGSAWQPWGAGDRRQQGLTARGGGGAWNGPWATGRAEKVLGKWAGTGRPVGALSPDSQQKSCTTTRVTCCFSYSFSLSRSVQISSVMAVVRFLHENQFSHQLWRLFRLSREVELLKGKITVYFLSLTSETVQ